jgi:peptide/nickel transport system ATP-binding protein
VGLETLDSGTIDLHIRPRPRSRSEKPQWLIEQRQAVQIVFQNPYSALNPSLSIGSAIREALRSVGRDPAEAATLLDHVGLPASYISRLPAELSGGERQRVAIARALAPQPRLLICDEAVSALDVSIQAQILELLASIQSKLGIALLFITHDLAVARQVSDRLLVMKDGAVVDSGLTEKLLVSPTHAYTRELLESVPGNAHDHTSAGSPR